MSWRTKSFSVWRGRNFDQFSFLLGKVIPLIQKMRQPSPINAVRATIQPDEGLAVTLPYLATRETYHSLEYSFLILRQTISSIVWETTRTLCKVLGSLLKSSIYFYNSIEIYILDIHLNFLYYRYTLQNIYWVPDTEREWDVVQTNSRRDGIFRMVSGL